MKDTSWFWNMEALIWKVSHSTLKNHKSCAIFSINLGGTTVLTEYNIQHPHQNPTLLKDEGNSEWTDALLAGQRKQQCFFNHEFLLFIVLGEPYMDWLHKLHCQAVIGLPYCSWDGRQMTFCLLALSQFVTMVTILSPLFLVRVTVAACQAAQTRHLWFIVVMP